MENVLVLFEKSLERLSDYHKKLFDILKFERKAMVDLDLEKINVFTYSKEALAADIQKENKKRKEILVLISKKINKDPQIINHNDIISIFENSKQNEIKGKIFSLTSLIEKTNLQNKANQEFIKHSMIHIENLKKGLLGINKVKNEIYESRGKVENKETGESGRLISKTV